MIEPTIRLIRTDDLRRDEVASLRALFDAAWSNKDGRFSEDDWTSASGGTHVVASGGNITLTDGPFTESKEVIVSFALIEVRSKDEALELARRFWKLVGDGEGDIRQVFGPGDE